MYLIRWGECNYVCIIGWGGCNNVCMIGWGGFICVYYNRVGWVQLSVYLIRWGGCIAFMFV